MKKIIKSILLILIILISISIILIGRNKYNIFESVKPAFSRKSIYIDPGHGGFDPGAVGDGIAEKDITLKCSLKLGEYLTQLGYNIIFTITNDTALAQTKREEMHKRLAIMSVNKNAIGISINANSFSDDSVHGLQTFYTNTNKTSKPLAESIHNIFKIQAMNKREPKLIKEKFLIENLIIPSCIVEIGFLSNKEEALKLKSDEYIATLAFYISIGIMDYIEKV